MTLSSNDFWQYSCKVYAQPNVSQHCVHLQDNFGCNINLLLLCCFLRHQGLGVANRDLLSVVSDIKQQDALLEVHRIKRKAAKSDAHQYELLKAQELELEKLQQQLLLKSIQPFIVSAAKNDAIDAFNACYKLSTNERQLRVAPVVNSSNL